MPDFLQQLRRAFCYSWRTVEASGTGVKERPSRELLLEAVLPLVRPLVVLSVRLGVNPLFIVAAHALSALGAATLIILGSQWWPWAAALLLLRMLLDNVDGSVARASGRVTLAGRYFDTGADLLTNACLFLALALVGNPLTALAAFLLLTLLLSLEFNLERLYREPRQVTGFKPDSEPESGPKWLLRPFRRLYNSVLAPQDRLIELVELARFRRLAGQPFELAPLDWRLAWFDRFATASLVNLGLSTQTLLLAVLLFAGFPGLYPVLVLLQGALVVLIQLWRGQRFRNYLQVVLTSAG